MTDEDPPPAPTDPGSTVASHRPGFSRELGLVVGLLVVALALRLFHLDFQNLWADEGMSAHFARGSLGESFTKVTQYDVHPPLYTFFLNGWTDLFGASDYSLRMPSALFSFATVFLVWRVASTLFGSRAALYSLTLATFSLYSIYYGQEARSYALLGLLSIVSMVLYLGFLRRPGWVSIALLSVVNGAMLYVNYFGLFVLAAQFWHVLTSHHRWRSLLLVNLISLLLFLPWIGQSLSHLDRFQKESYLQVPGLEKLILAFPMLLSKWAYGWFPLFLTAGVVLALVLIVTLSAFARSRAGIAWLWSPQAQSLDHQHSRSALLLVFWLLLPVLVSWTVSQFGIRVFDVKVLSVATPALLILVGHGLSRLRWQSLAVGLLLLLIADSALRYRRNYYQPHKPRYQLAMEYLASQGEGPHLVVCDPEYCGLAAHRYADQGSTKVVALNEAIRSPSFWLLEIKQGDPKKLRYLRRLGYRGTERETFPKIKVWYWTR